MKKVFIVALTVLNVGLLAWVLSNALPQARGQAARGVPDYIMVTGRDARNDGAVWILDLNSRKLLAWRSDPNRKGRMAPFRGRELIKDFGREREIRR